MCHDELMMMLYVDGELDESRRRELDAHLSECGRCGALVAALRVETRVLAEALRDAGAVSAEAGAALLPVYAAPSKARVVAAVAMSAVSAGILRLLVESASVPVASWLPDWLNPFQPEGLATLLFSAVVYLVQEGEVIMSSLVTTAGLVALGVLALTALSAVGRVRLRGGPVSLMALSVLVLATPVDAMDVRRGPATVTISADQTVDDTLVALGDTVQIDGIVTGDLIALGRRVRVRGTVMGNLITLARDVEVDGSVEGSIVQFGQTVTMRGKTNGNLYAFGQTISVPSGGAVGGNATTFSETTTIEGAVGTGPVGWFSPVAAPTVQTAEFLAEAGYLWHGDYNDTDLPYALETPKGRLVAIAHSDFTDNRTLRASPRDFYNAYKDTFDYLYKHEAPSIINLTVHAHFGGRPLMSAMLHELLHYMKGFSGVWFARHDEVARWVLKQN